MMRRKKCRIGLEGKEDSGIVRRFWYSGRMIGSVHSFLPGCILVVANLNIIERCVDTNGLRSAASTRS